MFLDDLFTQNSLTVTEINLYIRQLMESDDVLQNVWVFGEVSNYTKASSGHIYFTLKDSGASLRCVIWRSNAERLRVLPENGLAVEAHGSVSVYEKGGQYQLYVSNLRPVGAGTLFQQFIRLKNKLEAEGLFDPERKMPIPKFPHTIGIVTSPTGAALQDMLNTLANRFPLARVVLAPTSVQGDKAPREIVQALHMLTETVHPDVILMGRGGGSLEDLWAFNDENVVRAVADSTIPIISGVGHETDFTLTDFASDLRAPTPTGAAVLATPDIEEMKQLLMATQVRLNDSIIQILNTLWIDLKNMLQALQICTPLNRVRNDIQRVDEMVFYLKHQMSAALKLKRTQLDGISKRLETLNPENILKRGYAIVNHQDGRIIRSVLDVSPGDEIFVHLVDGKLVADVKDTGKR